MGEWKDCNLGDVIDKIIDNRGKNPPYSISGHEVIETGCISGKNKYPDYFLVKKYVDEDTYQNWFRSGHPQQNDLLIITVGNGIGSVSIMAEDRGVLTQNLIGLRFSEFGDSNFYYYYLKQEAIQDFLRSMNIGSAQPSLKVPHLLGIEVPLPPYMIQKAIASVLSSLDDKIDLLHRQNKTLEAMAETLFRQWFVEEAAEDWVEGTIAQLISIQNGYAFKSKDFKVTGKHGVIKIKNISGGIIDIDHTDFIDQNVADATNEQFKIKPGDILIAMTGAEIGKLGIIPTSVKELWLNQRVGLLKEKYYGSKYLAYLQLKSELGQDHIENTATGSAQPNISGSGIENCDFPKISSNKIKKCSLQVAELYEKLIFNLGQIRTLEKLRDTLLPKLMSGEVRVVF